MLASLAPYVTILVTVILFFINRWMERRHEVFKRSLDFRIAMRNDLLEFIDYMIDLSKKGTEDANFPARVFGLRRKVMLFGTDAEYELFEKFGTAFFTEKNVKKANQLGNELIVLFTNNIRKELGMSKRKFIHLPDVN